MRRPASSRRRGAPEWRGLARAGIVLAVVGAVEVAARRRARTGSPAPGASSSGGVPRGSSDDGVVGVGGVERVDGDGGAPDEDRTSAAATPARVAGTERWTRPLAGAVAVLLVLGVMGAALHRGPDRRSGVRVAAASAALAPTNQGPDDPLANIRMGSDATGLAPAAPVQTRARAVAPPRPISTGAAVLAATVVPPAAPPAGGDGPGRVEARTLTSAERLPKGKGMWLHNFDNSEDGDAAAIVAKATAAGLQHVFVRLGDSKAGFYAQPYLDRLLPIAHAAGLEVVGWDFPFLANADQDADRAAAEIAYRTPDGFAVDAFSADVETAAEGTNLSVGTMLAYSTRLRALAGAQFPLIATVPRPSGARGFPYAEAAKAFDAFAPMVYWMNRDPAAEVSAAIDALSVFGKPVLPVGQAYDGAVDGGPAGAPTKDALERFIAAATAKGATGFSFWSWQTATPDHWAAITESHAP